MKRHILVYISALCAVAACTLASCGWIEEVPTNEPETIEEPAAPQIAFTATLAPKGEDPQSKAITTGTEGGKEVLNVAWAADEQIAVYYQTGAESYATAIATVESVDAMTGEATITATLTGAIDGGAAKFVYPATLHNGTGQIDETALLSQNGNLTGANGISTKFDAATGEGTINVSGSEASVSGTVTMTNRVCICKFHFDIVDGGTVGPEREFSPIIIRDGNSHTYTITSDKQNDYGIGSRGFKRSDDIYIALLPVSGKAFTFYNSSLGSGGYNNYLYTASNTTLTVGKFYRNLSIDMVKDANTSPLPFKDLAKGSVSAFDGDVIYMSSSEATSHTITIADGATVTIENVNIRATASAGIICSGNATIILDGTNTVTTTVEEYPAIQAGGSSTTLTIKGSGSVTATGGAYGAGIGTRSGSKYGVCGDIVFESGTVMSKGGEDGAGIGSGYNGICGNITISGGTVTAMSRGYGAGIGSGYRSGADIIGSCGTITISGGTVTATGGIFGAGIGSGAQGICGNITISGGIGIYTGGRYAAGIGCGYNSICGDITITDGVIRVTATRYDFYYCPYSIGLGSELNSVTYTCGTITIGGTVYYDGTNFLNNGDTYLATSPLVYPAQ